MKTYKGIWKINKLEEFLMSKFFRCFQTHLYQIICLFMRLMSCQQFFSHFTTFIIDWEHWRYLTVRESKTNHLAMEPPSLSGILFKITYWPFRLILAYYSIKVIKKSLLLLHQFHSALNCKLFTLKTITHPDFMLLDSLHGE